MKSSREWIIEWRFVNNQWWYVEKISNGKPMRPATFEQAIARWSKDWKHSNRTLTPCILRFRNVETGEIIPEELLQ